MGPRAGPNVSKKSKSVVRAVNRTSGRPDALPTGFFPSGSLADTLTLILLMWRIG